MPSLNVNPQRLPPSKSAIVLRGEDGSRLKLQNIISLLMTVIPDE